MYAIIESCGKQYKVAEGDVVFFEKLDAKFAMIYPTTTEDAKLRSAHPNM